MCFELWPVLGMLFLRIKVFYNKFLSVNKNYIFILQQFGKGQMTQVWKRKDESIHLQYI